MLNWIRTSVTCAALALSTPVLAQATEETLLAVDAEEHRIIAEGDVEALRLLLHDNFIINGPTGRVTRQADLLAAIESGRLATDSFERTVEGTQITDNVGIVMGREEVVPASGSLLEGLYGHVAISRVFTNVCIYEDGRWWYLARQATVVPVVEPKLPV